MTNKHPPASLALYPMQGMRSLSSEQNNLDTSEALEHHKAVCMMQPGDTAGVLALRAMPLLLAAAAAAASFPAYAWQAAVVGLCALSPLPDAVSSRTLSIVILVGVCSGLTTQLRWNQVPACRCIYTAVLQAGSLSHHGCRFLS